MSEFKKYILSINENQGQPVEDAGYAVEAAAKIVALNFETFKKRGPQMTLVCSGAIRGGSSILPYLFANMGIPMGNIEADTYEDTDMLKNRQSTEAMRKIIAQRNVQDRWGFKIPSLRRGQLGFFDEALRNPVFVYIMRNPVIAAQSLVQRSKVEKFSADRKGFGNALFDCVTSYVEFVAFMRQTRSPCLILPMETIAIAPTEAVSFVAQCLDLNLDDALMNSLADEVRVSGYKPRREA